jgi:hypothetical protein
MVGRIHASANEMARTRTSGQGRPKGSLNKRNLDVVERLAKMRCDPIAGMARIAMNRRNPLDIRSRMYAELAQYVAPKRRALEHSTEPGMIEALLARIDEERTIDEVALLPGPVIDVVS